MADNETFGQYLYRDAIPTGYRPTGALTKGNLQKSMIRLAKDDPDQYAKTISSVKFLGDQISTLEGLSVGLDDIEPDYTLRNAVTHPAMAKIQKMTNREDRKNLIGKAQSDLLEVAKQHPGTMGIMARSGGRGNMVQLMKAVGSPVAANDEKDNVQPWLITRSYSEGLRPSEWWVANREARMAAVKSNIEVTEPGDLSKIIISNTQGQVVTMRDCNTTNGLQMSTSSGEIVDRYLAQPAGGYPAETRITTPVAEALKKKVAQVIVRSPMTCEAGQGVCQLCMGHTVVGKLNVIGDNVGIRAAHALGEPLTQLALNAKHGVRTAGGSAGVTGLTGFRAILETPASFKNKATLATRDGKVESITAAPQGGHYVTIAGERMHVPPGLAVLVTVGQSVHGGDVLSEGVPRPDEVVKYKGLGAGRDYIIEKLSGIYKDSGINVDRRHFEILAKSNLNHMTVDEVEDNEHGIVRGDTIDFNKFKKLVGESTKEMGIDEAMGSYLAKGVLHHLPGAVMTASLAADLKRRGVSKVTVATLAPRVSPFMSPATRNPLLNPDWMVRAGHRLLKQSITDGAQQGQSADIRGANPIGPMVFSPDFGEGPDGAY